MAMPPPNYDEMRAFYPVSGAMELAAEPRYTSQPTPSVLNTCSIPSDPTTVLRLYWERTYAIDIF